MTESINILLNCSNFPGLTFEDKRSVYVGIQKKQAVVDAVPGDSTEAVFSVPVQIREGRDGGLDFFGPYVHGKVGDRFIYLVWFENDSKQERFRRAKIKLGHLTWSQVQRKTVEAQVTMTDSRGGPVCATLPGAFISWKG